MAENERGGDDRERKIREELNNPEPLCCAKCSARKWMFDAAYLTGVIKALRGQLAYERAEYWRVQKRLGASAPIAEWTPHLSNLWHCSICGAWHHEDDTYCPELDG